MFIIALLQQRIKPVETFTKRAQFPRNLRRILLPRLALFLMIYAFCETGYFVQIRWFIFRYSSMVITP